MSLVARAGSARNSNPSDKLGVVKSKPAVSIVLPLFDDETTLVMALESALAQTLTEIEILCVDDASTDGTSKIVESFMARDPRVRLIRHASNRSAFQARRSGVLAANSDYVLFLDGDDVLMPTVAEKALAEAHANEADLVGFGVRIVERTGATGGSYERRLQPKHRRLEGTAVLAGLFPLGKPAQGQLWRYLFKTDLLRRAYALLPVDLSLPRVNDLPLMFLVAALATRYVSFEEKLYEYHFGRGGSGQVVDSVARAEFYASAVGSVDCIRDAVEVIERSHADPRLVRESYESARLSIVGYVGSQLLDKSDSNVVDAALAHLHSVAPAEDIIRGVARFYPQALSDLKYHTPRQSTMAAAPRSVLLATSTLRTGGVSAVIASQAQYLRESGFEVTIVARSQGSDPLAIPQGVQFVELEKSTLVDRLEEWAAICRTHEIDVVIDHQVLYTKYWPEFALMARSEGAVTVGWLHNFVGRPVYDGSDRLSLIERASNTVVQLVTLSPLDVSYFKLRGVEHVSYVPNPPSLMLRESVAAPVEKLAPRGTVNLIWWGRLEQHTKRITDLIEIGVHLAALDIDFRLTVIGPDWDDMTAKKFNALARKRRVAERVMAIGALHGADLVNAIDSADAFVSTSIIEGYQLTIAEAQARALPVFMYELPWLTLVDQNEGIVTVRQGHARAMAYAIAEVMRDASRYRALSVAAVTAAARALSPDFSALYKGVVTGTLPREYSPEPTLNDARQLLGLMVFFAENGKHGSGPKISRSEANSRDRLWRAAAPLGRKVLRTLPGLRPIAHRLKGWLKTL